MIKFHVLQNNIEVIGVTSNSIICKKVDVYPFIEKVELLNKKFDILIIMSLGYLNEIKKEAISIGIDERQIVACDVFNIPNFNLKQYLGIKWSNLTIFSNNCCGGYTYHRLRIKFLSPFINMYLLDYDYLKFLDNPREYLGKDLILKEMKYNQNVSSYYPICFCNDILLYFLHYDNFDEVKQKWNERKMRINWKNIFVMMYTEDMEIAKRFVKLSYEKKVCFVPFETKEESLFYINYRNTSEMSNKRFSEIVNGSVTGKYVYYDILNLLSGNIHSNRLEMR